MTLRFLSRIDWVLLLILLGLCIWGLLGLYSVAASMPAGGNADPFLRQWPVIVAGFIITIVIANLHPRFIYRVTYFAYIFSIFLLILVLILGKTGMGATRWLSIGGAIQFQPSELAKITTLLAVARFLQDTRKAVRSWQVFLQTLLLVVLPWALVFIEPDLGTSLVFLSFLFPVLYWRGFSLLHIVLIIYPLFTLLSVANTWAIALVFALLLILLMRQRFSWRLKIAIVIVNVLFAMAANPLWDSLKPYQQNRILTFLDPSSDPRGAGYQVLQSMLTIGSGGFSGQGFMQGSQTQLGFIPEQHTDFVLTAIGEEFGFVGIFTILLLFLLFVFRLIWMAQHVRISFAGVFLVGFATILLFHVIVNIGMTLGLMPVTGLPLPFLSFGRSSLLTFFALTGLALSFNKYRMDV
jgi:rod shape determining protein RodA